MIELAQISRVASLVGFTIGVPTTIGTYYQVLKTRRESKEARQGLIYSANCLEFVEDDGTFVNVVPLETLHSLPKPGDVVLLPGSGKAKAGDYGAYQVSRIEHIYSRVERKQAMEGQARLAKAVAHVTPLSKAVAEPGREFQTFAG